MNKVGQFSHQDIKIFLDDKVARYNRPEFIEDDPISIPHSYSKKQDIEITGFWTAVLSWGQRKTIINKSISLFELMDNAPHDFITNHTAADLLPFEKFKHRTFLSDDTLYFIAALKQIYLDHQSLEEVFIFDDQPFDMATSLTKFHKLFFSLSEGLERTKKHLPSPERGSTCKRLNMFMRWMVRQDTNGVDFGIWKNIPTSALMIPYDLHVDRVVRHYGLAERQQRDWKLVEEVTSFCRTLDPVDPAKYDYALFGLSVSGELSF
ncbi:MAG TPA: TIGR02757 family protein [Saprospiraceae bacterium]|nr:TIGR02757 family protein [Saprospiraceae bacterium]